MVGENLKQLIIRTNLVTVILLRFHVTSPHRSLRSLAPIHRLNYEFVLKDAHIHFKKSSIFFISYDHATKWSLFQVVWCVASMSEGTILTNASRHKLGIS